MILPKNTNMDAAHAARQIVHAAGREALRTTLYAETGLQIVEMRGAGMTFEGIANALNDLGVRTPYGRLWVAASVRRVVLLFT